jgi:transcription initiation factor TFIIH subunit 3
MQQATHITGGLYFRLDASAQGGLLQCLPNYLVCDTTTRGLLEVSQAQGVDFRAACFCHKKTIDVGYVCSVCLSIFCAPISVCSTCATEFSNKAV